jgi:hypothetical protein
LNCNNDTAQRRPCASEASTPLLTSTFRSDLSGGGIQGDLLNDNYVYENLPQLTKLDLSNNALGYHLNTIPNNLSLLPKLEYLCVLLLAGPVHALLDVVDRPRARAETACVRWPGRFAPLAHPRVMRYGVGSQTTAL